LTTEGGARVYTRRVVGQRQHLISLNTWHFTNSGILAVLCRPNLERRRILQDVAIKLVNYRKIKTSLYEKLVPDVKFIPT
jgi:hypothetical protein